MRYPTQAAGTVTNNVVQVNEEIVFNHFASSAGINTSQLVIDVPLILERFDVNQITSAVAGNSIASSCNVTLPFMPVITVFDWILTSSGIVESRYMSHSFPLYLPINTIINYTTAITGTAQGVINLHCRYDEGQLKQSESDCGWLRRIIGECKNDGTESFS